MLCIKTLRNFTERIPLSWAKGTNGKLINPIANNIPLPRSDYFMFGILRGSGDIFRRCQQFGYTFYYADHAYLYNNSFPKHSTYRITKNWHCNYFIQNRPADRYKLFKKKELADWKKNENGYILICPPSLYIQIFDNQFDWLIKTVSNIKKYTNRKIIIREKLVSDQLYEAARIKKTIINEEYSTKSLDEDIHNAWCVVTYNSMVAIDALIEGVPVFTDSKMSVAYQMAETNIENIEKPFYPNNRQEFLNHLAYSQFTIEEMQNGEAFKILNS